MQNYSSSPLEIFKSIIRNRHLILVLIKREISERYQGSIMGLAWSFINPLLMLSIYTFVFSEIFKTRWSGGGDSKVEFALILFSGLAFFSLFSECFVKAPTLVVSNINYVKKVIFPLEILPMVSMGAALFNLFISLGIWMCVYLLYFGQLKLTLFYLPFIFIPFIFLIMGFSWALASLGVYFRDLPQLAPILVSLLMFLSPIFYPVSALPESYHSIFLLNPISPVIEWARNMMFFGILPDLDSLFTYWILCFFVAYTGFFWFQRIRKGFADVI